MLAQLRRVFLQEDYLVTRLYRSERVLDKYNDVHALSACGLNVDLGSYTGAPRIIGTVAPVPVGFAVMPLFVLRYYAGDVFNWRADPAGSERAILQKFLQWFELAVLWEHLLALMRTASTEMTQNKRVPVWPLDVVDNILTRPNMLPDDERLESYW